MQKACIPSLTHHRISSVVLRYGQSRTSHPKYLGVDFRVCTAGRKVFVYSYPHIALLDYGGALFHPDFPSAVPARRHDASSPFAFRLGLVLRKQGAHQ